MARNDGVEVRKERIQMVIQKTVALLNNNKTCNEFPLDVFLADIQYETGLTERKILEYLAIGERRGLFIINMKNRQIERIPKS